MNDAVRKGQEFTPALGARWLTPFYDHAIAALTREKTWRRALVALIDPLPDDRILDIGCGTGSLAVLLASKADVVGIDPDEMVLDTARKKAEIAGVAPRFVKGFFSAGILPTDWRPTKITSSLVLHQTPIVEKRRILTNIRELLPENGVLCLADYGFQRSPMQRFLFRQTVQRLDGIENTQPNADGILETLLTEVGFAEVSPVKVIPTLTGAISLWSARPAMN